ncbi:protein-methionine-sulfoxide reductase heme-binding subunit MsrQ [Pseudopelagicola sp. nBUS_20]|uniref:protein-methionine-sulfoxide reductase heme-binding subunit MsrQ n=1 Tax=Pseudopelagicola sp. nBUS_20 TaxID=3395317 RepID=UPI003EBC405C
MTSTIESVNRALRKLPDWPLYVVTLLYLMLMLYQAVSGALGVDPVKSLEHNLGRRSLQVLILSLSVTPLRRLTGLNLIKFRRAIGLIAFTFVCLHLLVWLILDVQIFSQVWADILKRPYITIGIVGFSLLVPLAVTSNNLSVRRLGRHWNSLHKLAYLAAVLGAMHFVMLVKGFQIEPLIYMVLVLTLLTLRIVPRHRRVRI